MKIGIDIHGVINRYPKLFTKLAKRCLQKGHEIHILTGMDWASAKEEMELFSVPYSHYFSIVDHHQKIGTPMKKKKSGWWMAGKLWDKSKGEYCAKNGIRIHFDNDLQYAQWFPKTCSFICVPEKGFDKTLEALGLSPKK
jgi:hypothetical protein